MRTTYAVTWQEGAGPVRHGKLEFHPSALVLEGFDRHGPQSQRIGYDHVTSLHVARTPSERLAGRQTLVIHRGTGASLRITGVVQPGIVTELAESLTVLRAAIPR
jgi:hypothetical protein